MLLPRPALIGHYLFPCKEDKEKKLFALLIYSFSLSHARTHTHASLIDRGSGRRLVLFALTFEYNQTLVLSNHRLAVDSDMPIVQLSLSAHISNLFACHSFLCSFFKKLFFLLFCHSFICPLCVFRARS